MAKFGPWKDAVIAAAGTASAEVDLEGEYEFLTARIPTLGDAATINPQVAEKTGGTFISVYALDDDATGCFLHATSSATTTMVVVFRIGGAQFIKMLSTGAQSTETTIPVRGFNR